MRSEAWRPAAAACNRSPREAMHEGLASAWRAALCARPRVFRRAPERLSALRPPLDSGERSKDANPGRRNAPRERGRLFVWRIPQYALLALMLRDASQRASAVEAPALATCCDAPQHEGAGAALGRDDDRSAQAKHQPVGVGNDRRLDFPVSSLLFTGHGATATCRARQRPSRIQVAARLPTRSKSPINPPNTGSTPMPRTTLASRVRSPNQSSPWKVSLERTATMRGR